ncbi:hypothetical protein H0E84_15170 [Luteimonas sp. SJ-92]|uniref:Immunity protein 35 domain-containing protein n=1 Tax=Luteimonas salinisoli TaxID=2752307 RepID=A0A853JEF8_9GAMM|nr:YrhB domain-containing protein [Luteimonas salinisoli]NZA27721.1 hypothetical protein [Luteimonas salinisoli]
MVTRNQARHLVRSQLKGCTAEIGCEVEIIDSATLERPLGWVFFYQSREFLLTGNSSSRLAGNAPLIVNRHSGRISVTGTAEPVEEYIARYEASLASGAD